MEGSVTILREPARWSLADLARLAAGPLEAAGALRAVVFGSYARGVADAWSDLDLAVVIDTDLPRFERGRLLEELHGAVPVSLDLLICTPSEFERGRAAGLDVFAAIADEGKTIFPTAAPAAAPAEGRARGNDPARTARRWLDTARQDLAFARHAAASGFHAPACFHAHQAAEKAMKALHYARGARVVRGHGIRQLIERLEAPDLGDRLPGARELDLLYLPTRYPNGLDDGAPEEAFSSEQSSRALGFAGDIVAAAAARLGSSPGGG